MLCVPVIRIEANKLKKKLFNYFAHLVVHGVLHMLEYDHDDDHHAIKMEIMEDKILKYLEIY